MFLQKIDDTQTNVYLIDEGGHWLKHNYHKNKNKL